MLRTAIAPPHWRGKLPSHLLGQRLEHELELRLRDRLLAGLLQRLGAGALAAAVDRLVARETDPATAARQLAEQMVG